MLIRILDLETTGFEPPAAEVIQIGWVDLVPKATDLAGLPCQWQVAAPPYGNHFVRPERLRASKAERQEQMTDIIKPPYGTPCNSCGECCRSELCPLGNYLFGHWSGPCDALSKDGRCRVVEAPQEFAPVKAVMVGVERLRQAALLLIGGGVGCDAQLDGEPGNPEFRRRMHRHYAAISPKVEQAKRDWGVEALR